MERPFCRYEDGSVNRSNSSGVDSTRSGIQWPGFPASTIIWRSGVVARRAIDSLGEDAGLADAVGKHNRVRWRARIGDCDVQIFANPERNEVQLLTDVKTQSHRQ